MFGGIYNPEEEGRRFPGHAPRAGNAGAAQRLEPDHGADPRESRLWGRRHRQCGRGGVVIACGSQALSLEELQLAGKGRIRAHEFAAQLDLSGQRLDGRPE